MLLGWGSSGAPICTDEAGVNRTYVSKLEKGTSYPGLEIIAKLATVLEVEPAELIRLPAPQPTPRVRRSASK